MKPTYAEGRDSTCSNDERNEGVKRRDDFTGLDDDPTAHDTCVPYLTIRPLERLFPGYGGICLSNSVGGAGMSV